MKVGLHRREVVAPQQGGWYTFSSEVESVILDRASQSGHEFVILDRTSDASVDSGFPGTQRISLRLPPSKPMDNRWRKVLRNLVFWRRNRRASVPSFSSEQDFARSQVQKHGIEFIVYLDPLVPVDLDDVPYAMVVYDLQHRLQPYFPEVSANGEFNRREQHYARCLRRASLILSGTMCGKQEIESFYAIPGNRIHVLPLPTPRYVCSPPPRSDEVLRKYGLPPGFLFYPAQFWSHKNHISLILAVRQLIEEHGVSLPVVFAGADHGNMEYVRAMTIKSGLADRVHFLGFVPQSDMLGLYQNALALVFLSAFGPDNIPPLEAFALGCPVIAAKVAGAEEQLRDNAILVDPFDVDAIAASLNLISRDQALRDGLIRQGLIRKQESTVEHYVDNVFSLLDKFERVRRCWR